MAYVIVVVLLVAVVIALAHPLWRAADADAQSDRSSATDLLELEAARDAKYREIRDAQLDHQTGKLSDEDFRMVDTALRAEAVGILRRLDRYHRRS